MKHNEKYERWAVYISVFISIASITSSGFLLYLFSSTKAKLADVFCVPCDKLNFSTFPNETEKKYKMLDKDYENGEKVCCGSTTQSTEALLDLISDRKLRESKIQERNDEIRDGYIKGSQISAHILMSGYDDKLQEKRPAELLKDRKLSHFNGVNITHDRINIRTKGKYFLYCQLYFKVILGTNLDKQEGILSYQIRRYNSKLPNYYTEKLLESKFTVQFKDGKIDDNDNKTDFLSGIFNFEAGDQLYVMYLEEEMSRTDKSIRDKYRRRTVYLSVFISIASITSSGFLLYLFSSTKAKLADVFCVPCDKLKCSTFPNETEKKCKMLDKDYENGEKVCCGSTTQSTEALLDLISERKLRESKIQDRNDEIRDGYIKGSQISAHILMSGYDDKLQEKRPVELLKDRKLSHFNGVNITHDRINIRTKGKYFLYCQLYFKVILGTNLDKQEGILSYQIRRYNSKLPNYYTEKLLESKFTVQFKDGKIDDNDNKTDFLSGIFNFEAGDQLYVMDESQHWLSSILLLPEIR
ncbi:hypothetical protein LOTGIDRAFT_231148 [Lottia gigantea]|uniref:THD domain-containing protein n=1 Tax=Lottia gigantea TaxID=225164 RepID=V4AUT9_LOTGI|nr:hypothetical protein LOTGIDRAFT_231148 [Lottia gigantea]ESO98730.1 hypothetical protein LOTGIDRAFT_231148 [Lottia gigantea]